MADREADELPRLASLHSEFEIVRELGRGGSAVVYLALERDLERLVAIKVIRPYQDDEQAAARLAQEARTAASLQHPNIVLLYGTRRLSDHSLALIMQYVPGYTLKTEVATRGALPFERVEQILTDIGSALSCAQRSRIVHRDIKPQNIYIDAETGRALLSDFGIARPWDVKQGLTLPGMAIGTPAYMSPEHLEGLELDGRSDHYSLGLVAYEMLTGRPPWEGENLFEIVHKQRYGTLPDLETVRPGIPDRLRYTLAGLLPKDREQRWRNADDFLAVLRGEAPLPKPSMAASATKVSQIVADQPSPILVDHDAPAEDKTFKRLTRGRAIVVAATLLLVPIGVWVLLANSRQQDELAGPSEPTASAVTGNTDSAGDQAVQAPGLPPPARVPTISPLELGTSPTATAESSPSSKVPVDSGNLLERAAEQPNRLAGARLRIRPGLTVGSSHTCVVNPEGRVVCWGGNNRGQLGVGSFGRHNGAATILAAEPFAMLSAGGSHTCGVGVRGLVFCWGANSEGQLGDGTRIDRAQPTRLASDVPIVRVFAGMSHSCGLDAAGRLYCWGQNTNGQLGDGTRTDRTEPVRVVAARNVRSVALGWAHTCALARDGTAFCWGRNGAGELGNGSTQDRTTPAPVGGGNRFTSIAAGSRHTCGLTVRGLVTCWGQNSHGQLGNDATEDKTVPLRVASTDTFTALALGSVHSCALTRAGAAHCWGRNTYGQLGDGTVENRSRPTPVVGGHRFRTLQASGAHTCGASGRSRFCWGYNIDGQLGDGTRVNQNRPVAVVRR